MDTLPFKGKLRNVVLSIASAYGASIKNKLIA
jgi:hypothetical protein